VSKLLSLESLGDLSLGQSGAVIDKAIRQTVADLDDRGDDGQPRKVNIQIVFKKLDSGTVTTKVEVEAKLPKYKTITTIAEIKSKGGEPKLQFQPHSPERPDQPSFLDEEEEKAKKAKRGE
jgi:hypothetical protein